MWVTKKLWLIYLYISIYSAKWLLSQTEQSQKMHLIKNYKEKGTELNDWGAAVFLAPTNLSYLH